MRIPRSTGAFSAVLLVLLGVWGGLIPFVGPYFDYSFGVNSSWHYTADRLWLSVLPAALTVLAGLLLLVASHRAAGIMGGWLAVLAGSWFAIGPAVSRTWEHAEGPIGRPLFGTTRQALELIGYFYGLGALIVALGAFAIGRFSSRPAIVRDPLRAGEPALAHGPAVVPDPAVAGAGGRAPWAPRRPAQPVPDPFVPVTRIAGEPQGGVAAEQAPAAASAAGTPPAARGRRRRGGLIGRRFFARGGDREGSLVGH